MRPKILAFVLLISFLPCWPSLPTQAFQHKFRLDLELNTWVSDNNKTFTIKQVGGILNFSLHYLEMVVLTCGKLSVIYRNSYLGPVFGLCNHIYLSATKQTNNMFNMWKQNRTERLTMHPPELQAQSQNDFSQMHFLLWIEFLPFELGKLVFLTSNMAKLIF